jgi:hypothetical protein
MFHPSLTAGTGQNRQVLAPGPAQGSITITLPREPEAPSGFYRLLAWQAAKEARWTRVVRPRRHWSGLVKERHIR